ncbi:hypothetical protein [Paracoccus suum]|uniref:hypothetical protein n=1 Tax=Paracoccus suum TaxID=2259340 RepID=UPI0018EFDFB3|nr:hypothetical protein [Paracoccus suum]
MRLFPVLASLTAALASPVLASSDKAWEEFRVEVETGCKALAEVPEGGKLLIEVSPQGSESYGAALVTVGLKDGGADRMVCIMDKKTRKFELAAAFLQTEGEGKAGGGMGKAEVKGPTAADKPAADAPAAVPIEAPAAPAAGDPPPPEKPAG